MSQTNSKQEPPVQYESHLLRLRHTTRDGRPVCQAMLIHLPSRETRYFSDLAGLMDYLEQGTVQFTQS